jgi:hypothetical protein
MGALAAVTHYLCRLLPLARREIAFWETRARAIRDPLIQKIALAKIDREGANVEAAVFFATLASRRWQAAVRRIVAFQLAYEYIDGVNEQQNKLEVGRRLHSALLQAVGGPASDHRGGHYLQELVSACRAVTAPSHELLSTVARVGEAQARNHAGAGLREWAERFAPDLLWWEAAAAGISSLDILALLGCPSHRHHHIPDAYVEVCALSALLDGVADIQADIRSPNHNFAQHYTSESELSERLLVLTRAAARSVRALPDGELHALALAGLLAHNLAAPSAAISSAPAVEAGLRDSLPWVRPAVAMFRLLRAMRLDGLFHSVEYSTQAVINGRFIRNTPSRGNHHPRICGLCDRDIEDRCCSWRCPQVTRARGSPKSARRSI